MNKNNQLCVKLFHCGNSNTVVPGEKEQKNIFYMPMGIFALADSLQKNGFDVEIIHSDLEYGKDIAEILDFDTVDAVGFPLHWVNQTVGVMDTTRRIKEINPEIFIFLGGFSASLFAQEIVANYTHVDAVIRGDGEIPIVELAQILLEEKKAGKSLIKNLAPQKLATVRNLTWKDASGHVTANEITYTGTATEMNTLDFAALELLRNYPSFVLLSKFWTNLLPPLSDAPIFNLEVGRGCQYACTFCGGNCVAQAKMNNRKATAIRSIETVVGTIKKAMSFGYKAFYTCTEYEGSDEWYIKLFERIKAENLDIIFVYGCWRLPSEGLADALAKNFKHSLIEISPETEDVELRKRNKDIRLFYSNEQLEKFLEYAKSKGNIKVQLFFGYYLAGDTKKTVLKTIAYILTLILKHPDLLEIEYDNFSTDPGSLFFFSPEEYDMDMKVRDFKDYVKLLREKYVEKKEREADMTAFNPRNLSPADDEVVRRSVRLLNYLFLFYRQSVSYILKKTASPHAIMLIIEGCDISVIQNNTFSTQDIQKTLIGSCEKLNVLDDVLLKLILFEGKKLASHYQMSVPATQLHLDRESQLVTEKDEVVDAMTRYVIEKNKSNGQDTSLEADFQLFNS